MIGKKWKYVTVKIPWLTYRGELELIAKDDPNFEVAKQLNDGLNRLSEREKKMIILCYGLDRGNPLTLKQIGNYFEIGGSRAGQLIKRGLSKLHKDSKIAQIFEQHKVKK